ncbi:suppressor of lurcher protein 1-like [Ctenocephalides felis]|nr:suppressor of lurcher protein 1-like [Ctenocephalides felis]
MVCGGRSEAPRTIYSSSSSLALSLHVPDYNLPEGAGFRGTFRFLDKRLFRTDGQKLAGTECDHQFLSGDLSPSSGHFHSPRYPATYPGKVSCSYRFRARPSERIKIVFEEFSMQKGDLSCADSDDVITVHDGGTRNAPVIRALCNEGAEVEVLSTGRELLVHFFAKSNIPGHGFKATFQFQGLHEIDSNHILEHAAGIFNAALNNVHTGSSDCDSFFNSDVAKEGIFTSPLYPSSYPAKTHCKFHFQGRGKERVQIVFTHFDLPGVSVDTKECDNSDRIDIYVPIEGRMEKTESLCTLGPDRLPGPVMSNGARMLLEFNGDGDVEGPPRSFKAVYRFTEDFGITSGRQVAEQPCAFSFESSSRMSGIFTSPNFPGSYPRDTECRYYFRGAPGLRVRLHFTYFDVEGVLPCEAVSASDYVEFSNYMTHDPKHRRHCGQVEEFTIDSEDNFFRVSFRSNDRLDGTGFEASYMFYSEDYGEIQHLEEEDSDDLESNVVTARGPSSVANKYNTSAVIVCLSALLKYLM